MKLNFEWNQAGRKNEIMIEVTKMDSHKILINPDHIEVVEETPDTVISLTTGRKFIVKESRQDIQNLVKSFKRDIFAKN